MEIIKISDFTGGLNTGEPTTIADNQLSIASNVYYDNQGILSTRKGTANWGDAIPGVTSTENLYSTTLEDGTKLLLAFAGTDLYKWNESTGAWTSIKSGLTAGTRFTFLTFLSKVYITNGVDDFMYYGSGAITTVPAVSKVKYLASDKGVIYGAGLSTDPSMLLYTTAGDELTTANFANTQLIDPTANGFITGLHMFQGLPVVGTNRGAYIVDIFQTNVEITPADFAGNVSSNSSMVNVENDQFFFSTSGLYSLAQRQGTTGSYRASSFSSSIQKEMDLVKEKETACAWYFKDKKNFYLSVNSNGIKNNSLFVYSVLVSNPSERKYAWTQYENINANDFAEYIDTATGTNHLLYADANSGQVKEMETGFSDEGLEIHSVVKSKTFDLGSPEVDKTLALMDVGGLISRQQEVNYLIDVDGVETTKTFNGSVYAVSPEAEVHALAEEALGVEVIGGGAIIQEGIVYSPFLVRRYPYQTGYRFSFTLDSYNSNSAWKLTKANIGIEAQKTDVLNNNFII